MLNFRKSYNFKKVTIFLMFLLFLQSPIYGTDMPIRFLLRVPLLNVYKRESPLTSRKYISKKGVSYPEGVRHLAIPIHTGKGEFYIIFLDTIDIVDVIKRICSEELFIRLFAKFKEMRGNLYIARAANISGIVEIDDSYRKQLKELYDIDADEGYLLFVGPKLSVEEDDYDYFSEMLFHEIFHLIERQKYPNLSVQADELISESNGAKFSGLKHLMFIWLSRTFIDAHMDITLIEEGFGDEVKNSADKFINHTISIHKCIDPATNAKVILYIQSYLFCVVPFLNTNLSLSDSNRDLIGKKLRPMLGDRIFEFTTELISKKIVPIMSRRGKYPTFRELVEIFDILEEQSGKGIWDDVGDSVLEENVNRLKSDTESCI